TVATDLLNLLGLGADVSRFIAAAVYFLDGARAKSDPKHERSSAVFDKLVMYAKEKSKTKNVSANNKKVWLARERLLDPSIFLPPLIAGLEALVPADAWLFNRADVPQSSPLQP
ncbi:MAG: hypothetical protein ACMG6S_04235, partial [Byssovorax sp.]